MASRATWVVVTAAAGMLGIARWQDRAPVMPPVEALTGFQDADAPLFLPADGQPRHRLHAFTAWQLAAIPAAHRFEPPLGSEHGALTYNAQKFWDMNDSRGGHHTGDDLNGIGGSNTDLGDPVFSTAEGLVGYAGEPSPAWGKVVILVHRDRDGRVLQSMYAHLDRIEVEPGRLVARGQRVGTVGTANGHHAAHLHFEIRRGDGIDVGAGYGRFPLNRLDPARTLAERSVAAPDDLAPSPLATALK